MSLLTRRLKEKGVTIPLAIRKKCFEKPWVIHAKPPAKGVSLVLEYIGRYAYRVAITNSRILDVADGRISYDYKMYKKSGKHGVMSMDTLICCLFISCLIILSEYVTMAYSLPATARSCAAYSSN